MFAFSLALELFARVASTRLSSKDDLDFKKMNSKIQALMKGALESALHPPIGIAESFAFRIFFGSQKLRILGFLKMLAFELLGSTWDLHYTHP